MTTNVTLAPRRRSTDGLTFYPEGHDPGAPILSDDATTIDYVGAWKWGQPGTFAERPHPLDVLDYLFDEEALDRRMAGRTDYRDPANRVDLLDPADEDLWRVHYHGNFLGYSCAFSIWTRDEALIAHLDRMWDRNTRRRDYLDQPDPQPGHIRDLWRKVHRETAAAGEHGQRAERYRDVLRAIHATVVDVDPASFDAAQALAVIQQATVDGLGYVPCRRPGDALPLDTPA